MTLQKLIKPVILTCALTANICAAMPTEAMDYNFATIKAGMVSPTSAPNGNSNLNIGNSTYTAGVLIGRKFMDRFAVDFEYMYRGKNTAKNANFTQNPSGNANNSTWTARSNTFMLSASADLITDCKIRPYVRAGVGIAKNKSDNYITNQYTNITTITTYPGKTTNEFAYQLGAGLAMNTSSIMDTQLEYMYVNHGKIKTNQGTMIGVGPATAYPAIDGYLKDHVITIGLKFKF